MSHLLVLGLGNTLQQDEGVGVHVISYLQQHPESLPPQTELLDGGTGGLHLVDPVAEAAALIVVDAARVGEAPGTVRTYPGEAMDRFIHAHKGWSAHDVGLPDLMGGVWLVCNGFPANRALVAVQPEEMDWGEHPSATVAPAIPEAARAVIEQAEQWQTRAASSQ